MKNILTLLTLLIACYCNGQDSTDIRLQKYKGMYEQGLIDSSEYKALRGKELGITQQTQTTQPTVVTIVRPANPVAKYKAELGFGGFFLGSGAALFIADFIYIANTGSKKVLPTNRKQNIIGISAGAGISLLMGAVLCGVGQHGKSIYQSKKASLDIQIRANTMGLAFNY